MTDLYIAFWLFLFGLVFGSFLNCTAMRIVRGEDFVRGRSRCLSCGHELRAADLIPLLTWLALRGRCRYCGDKISVRYPLSEVTFALLLEGLFFRYGPGASFAGSAVLTGCLFVLSLVDLESLEIPDGCLVIGLLAFCVTAPFTLSGAKDFLIHLASGLTYGGLMLVLSLVMDDLLKRDSMGGGDIKLYALLGLWFGFIETLILIFISCIIGLVFASAWKMRKNTDGVFPFGPSIAMAAYVMLMGGDCLRDWYVAFL